MHKKWRLGLTILLLFSSLMLALPCGAQGGIEVTRNAYEYAFREHITFRLEASSDAGIAEVTLFARVSGESARQRDEPDFEPGKSVSVEVVWDDMAEDAYRPPGVTIGYWWKIQDSAGNELETDALTFVYLDNRHEWRVLENEAVALYWYKGKDSHGSTLFERAVQAIDQISSELGVDVEDQLKIFIYGSYDDLRAALGEGAHEWVGGMSFTDYAIVAAGVSPDNLAYGLRVVPHELTHAVIAQMMEPPFGQLPHWMDEGLAMHYEGGMTADERAMLHSAIQDNSLLSIRSLASNFPEDYDLAILSYAESNSVVEFIFDVYGSEAMAQLLEVFAVGAHQDDGFIKVLGFDVDGLEDEWRAYIGAPPREGVTRATPVPRPTTTPTETLEAATATPVSQPTATPQAAAVATDTAQPEATLTPFESQEETPTPESEAEETPTPEPEPLTGLCSPCPLPGAALLALFLLFRPRAAK